MSLLGLLPGQVLADGTVALVPDKTSVTASGGETFTVNLDQRAATPTTGAQTNLFFDTSMLEFVDMRAGSAYANGLFLFGSVDDGSNASIAAAVVHANATGHLDNIGAFLLPGSGSVPAGDNPFLALTFRAKEGPGGESRIGFVQAFLLDENGGQINAPIASVTVTVGASAAPSGGTSSPSSAPSPTGSPLAPTVAPSSGGSGGPVDLSAGMSVDPTSVQIATGASATFDVKVSSGFPASGASLSLAFDPKVLEITGITKGERWSRATILAGGAGKSLDDAISEANGTGALENVSVLLLPGSGELPTGDSVVLSVAVKGRVDGASPVTLTSASVIDAKGSEVKIQLAGQGADQGGGFDLTGPLALLIMFVLIAGVALVTRSHRIPRRWTRRAPYVIALLLALIPVVMFAAMVAMLVVNSAPILTNPGVGALLSDQFSSTRSLSGAVGTYGLVPALWGTFEITAIAIVVALPVSLAMAVVSAEFQMGPLGRLLRPLLGVLSGVPPIVYAVASVIFVTVFMAPKFAGSADFISFDSTKLGVAAGSWPPPGVPWGTYAFPWPPNATGVPNSTLLGGLLIALLVIPFMAPLILDAFRNVPSDAREASFALGATRSYTLRRVIIPRALPGIVAALTLATLKALGDVLIIALAVNWQAETLPNPLFDVFERTSTLAAEGAGLLGHLEKGGGSSCGAHPIACTVGYTSGLVLLVVAAGIVVIAAIAEARLRRRLQV